MKVLHVVSATRWTGAAAPALAEVEALRARGVEAFFGYVGGETLQERLRTADWARPVIEKKQHPFALRRSVAMVSDFVTENGIDLVHTHLTWDHTLALLLQRKHRALRLFRTFHSRRTLRRDPFTHYGLRHTTGVAVINESFLNHPAISRFRAVFTPPAIDHQFFRPDGPDARGMLRIDAATPLFGTIGKVAPKRGFEEVLQTFAVIRRQLRNAHLLIIGQGPHRPRLEELSRELGVEPAVTWAGYHESDLPEHFRAIDVLLFAVTGSDEGHRAVSEALACGVPVASYPLPGVRPLCGSLAPRLVASEASPESLARTAIEIAGVGSSLREECVKASRLNNLNGAADRLLGLYRQPSV